MEQTDRRKDLAYPVTDALLVPYLNQDIAISKAAGIHTGEPSLFGNGTSHL
jgi:hypothetical protein